MEEILASIRRIISDDQAVKPGTAPKVAAADDEEVLDLAPKPLAPKPLISAPLTAQPAARQPEPHFITDDPVDNDLSFDDPMAAQATSEPAKGQDDIDVLMAAAEFEATPAPLPEAVSAPMERLVSPATDRMVTTAFSSLANTVLANNARTLDDLVQDMMRPMIKSWLDDNLPSVVERLVRAEIERVARGGR